MRKLVALILGVGLLSTSALAVDAAQQRAQKSNRRASKRYVKSQRKAMKKAARGHHKSKNRA